MRLELRTGLAIGLVTVVACGGGFSSAAGGSDGGGDVLTVDSGVVGDVDSGGVVDSGVVIDSGVADTGIAPVEAGPSWCSLQTLTASDFCEDFDEQPTVQQFLATWTTDSSVGGSFSFIGNGVPSPPNALEMTTSSTSDVNAMAIRALPPAPNGPIKHQRLEFSLFIGQAGGIGGLAAAGIAAIAFGNDVTTGGVVALAFEAPGLGSGQPASLSAIYVGPKPADGGLQAFGQSAAGGNFPTLGQWDGRFAIEIDYPPPDASATAAGPCAQLFIGSVAQGTCLALPPDLSSPQKVTAIALGVYSGGIGSSGSETVAFDNVLYLVE